jgi:GT2 family glycosyltransferase
MTHIVKLPSVAIVSVTHNRCEPLLVLLRQVQALDYDPGCLDIFLVDNASTDNTVARIRQEFPHVQLVLSKENTGVSSGFNRSIQACLASGREYKYLWLLDSDAEVEPSTLRCMVEAMEADASLGVVGSAVYDPVERARLVTAGLRVDWSVCDIPLLVPDEESRSALVDVDLIPACSMLTRATLYQRIGLWDARFPLYWGDTDWCARVLHDGSRVCCDVRSRVWHRDWSYVIRGFGASVFIRDHIRGGLLFYLRHNPLHSLHSIRRFIIKTHFKAALERLTLRQGFRRAYLAAIEDVLVGRFDKQITLPEGEPPLQSLDRIGAELRRIVTERRPRILLNQIADEDQKWRIKSVMSGYFDTIDWFEIAPDQSGGKWAEYRVFKPGQLLAHAGRVLNGMHTININICSVSRPLLYNLFVGRYVVLIDAADNGIIEHNAPWSGILDVLWTVLQGFKSAYSDLPRSLRSSSSLTEALAGGDVFKNNQDSANV